MERLGPPRSSANSVYFVCEVLNDSSYFTCKCGIFSNKDKSSIIRSSVEGNWWEGGTSDQVKISRK